MQMEQGLTGGVLQCRWNRAWQEVCFSADGTGPDRRCASVQMEQGLTGGVLQYRWNRA